MGARRRNKETSPNKLMKTTPVRRKTRKYARKSFLFSCRCLFLLPSSLFVSCADSFPCVAPFHTSHRAPSRSVARAHKKLSPCCLVGKFGALLSSSLSPVDVVMPYLIRFDDIAGVWLLSPLRYHHLRQQPNQA